MSKRRSTRRMRGGVSEKTIAAATDELYANLVKVREIREDEIDYEISQIHHIIDSLVKQIGEKIKETKKFNFICDRVTQITLTINNDDFTKKLIQRMIEIYTKYKNQAGSTVTGQATKALKHGITALRGIVNPNHPTQTPLSIDKTIEILVELKDRGQSTRDLCTMVQLRNRIN